MAYQSPGAVELAALIACQGFSQPAQAVQQTTRQVLEVLEPIRFCRSEAIESVDRLGIFLHRIVEPPHIDHSARRPRDAGDEFVDFFTGCIGTDRLELRLERVTNEAPPQTDEACGGCGSEAEPR